MPKKVHIPRPYIIPIRSEPTHERDVAISHPPVSQEVLDRIELGVQKMPLYAGGDGGGATTTTLLNLLRGAIDQYNLPLEVMPGPGHRYVSLTKLASDVGISLSHLSRILTRQRKPSFPIAIRLADAMGMTLDRLAEYLGVTSKV